MPIINKGVFDIDSVYLREVGNDWPTAQVITTSDVIETTNQYFTNVRVIGALVGANVSLNKLTSNIVNVSNITSSDGNSITLHAKDANSLLRNEIKLDPNNGTYMGVWSGELNTAFSEGSWANALWIESAEEGGVAVITNAETIYDFWNTGVGSFETIVIEVSINGGSRIPVQYNSGNAVSGNVSLDLANGQPSGVPPTSPTAITSLNFFYRTKSSINIDYYGGEILLDAQSMDIDLRTTNNLDLRSSQNLNLRGLGVYPVRIYTSGTNRMWEFDAGGSLTLPREGNIYGIGAGSASDRYGSMSWVGNSSGDGLGFNTMKLVPDILLESADQYIIIDPTSGVPGHIHIRAGGTQDNSQANLYLGGESSHVLLGAGLNPPVTIAANNKIWTFGTDGTLTLPASGNILGSATISSENLVGNIVTANIITSSVWNNIYTANVIESPTKLYYTDDRVAANVSNLSVGALFDVIISGNLETGQALVYSSNANAFIPIFVNSEVANVADIAGRVLSLENQTTANVREASSNLYFTNTRVLDAISLATINPGNINAQNIVVDVITANTWNRLYSSNVIEFNNLFYTNSRVISAVVPLLTTANVVELSSNLYFTNTRVLDAIAFADITNTKNLNALGNIVARIIFADAVYANTITSTGIISTTAVFDSLIVNTNTIFYGDVTTYGANNLSISDNMIYLNNESTQTNPDMGWVGNYNDGNYQHAGFFRDASDGIFKVFDNYTLEPDANIFIDTTNVSFRLANLQATNYFGNVTGFVTGQVSSISNHNSDALAEGSVKLYYTNSVISAVTPLLTTANVSELTNQYFTNSRVISAVTPLLTTANVSELTNQYFTNARVLANVEQMSINVLADVDITDVSVNSVLTWNGTKFVPGATDVALRANFANTAGSANVALLAAVANIALLTNFANAVLSLSNFTTANLAEGSNLYFTNTRARSAFTAGKGIVIQDNGTIKNTGSPPEYNLSINGTGGGNVLGAMSALITFPNVTNDRYLLSSIHLVNTSNDTALISGNILYATGNTAVFANKIPVGEGSVVEFIKRGQIFQPNDKINLQGFNSSGVATSNLMSVMYTYETFDTDISYIGLGQTIATSNTQTQIYDSSQSYSIIESIKFVNLSTGNTPIRLVWADANGVPKAHLAYNVQIPANSSLEILQKPKRIEQYDKLYASYANAANATMSVFVSARIGAAYTISTYTAAAIPGNTLSLAFFTTDNEGTSLYYTIE
jgi:hypothetical protein